VQQGVQILDRVSMVRCIFSRTMTN